MTEQTVGDVTNEESDEDILFDELTAKHFIVTADWHSGLLRYSRDTRGIPDRHTELRNSIGAIFRHALETKASFVVVLGDIFDTNHPSQLCYADFIPIFKEVESHGLNVFMFPGNHDAVNTIPQINALRTIFKSKLKNFRIFNDMYLETDFNLDYQFLFIPHINRCEYSSFSEDAEKKLIMKKYKALKPDPNKKTLVFGHAMVPGSIQGAEHLVMRGGEQTFDVDIPAAAYFFGHMHTPQEMMYKGAPLYYPGSLQAVDFSERNDEKGFLDVYMKGNKLEVKRLPVPTRKMVQIDVGSHDEFKAMFSNAEKRKETGKDSSDKIVKVRLNIPSSDKDAIQESLIESCFEGAYWLEIDYNLQRDVAQRNENVTTEVDPDIALKEWYTGKKYPEKDYAEIEKRHKQIITEASTLRE